jgi:hypothetical protein
MDDSYVVCLTLWGIPLRLLKLRRRIAPYVLASVLVTVAMSMAAQQAAAQLQGKIADRPLVVGYARNISPVRVMDYARNLTERLNIGESIREQMASERQQENLESLVPKVEEPLYGFAMYMVSGLIPSVEMISFQQVIDDADAKRLVNGRKQQFAENGVLEELPNHCFRVQYTFSNSSPLPPGADEAQFETNNSDVWPRGYQVTQKVVEKDGVKYLEHSQVMTSLYRYHDRMLYEANFEELFEMQLPSAEAIASGVDGSRDLGFNAYLDRIPQALRQLGWNMLTAAVGSQLQQQDEESDTSYHLRKSAGDLGLTIVQAVLFDVDSSDGWATFANVDADSLHGALRVRARKNSSLSKQLVDAAGNSRFAPVLSDNAAATLHVCVRLPEEASVVFEATGKWLVETMDRELNGNATARDASRVLAEVLAGIGGHRNVELMIKAGWTEASAGVFYGGLQLTEHPEFLRTLHSLLILAEGLEGVDRLVTLEEREGMQVIVIRPPEEVVEELKASLGTSITHLYLAHENSCFWFAAGTENAFEIIRQSVARCSENTRAARTPLISGRIDMERWLSYSQEDPSGIAQLPHWLDENAWWFPPSPFGIGFGGQQGRPNPIMQRVFDLGGSQLAGFSLEADEGGLLLQASLGEALANHMMARMIDAQENRMNDVEELQLQDSEKLREALEAAETELKPPGE